MPGIAIKLSQNALQTTEQHEFLNKIMNVYKVPNISYSEDYLINSFFIVYVCYPDFIKEQKLASINNYIIALDGDFYNLEEVQEIINKGKSSKLETIFYLYKKFGDDFAKYLNGDFVIVIINKISKEILITNDRFARRPFFFHESKNEVLFSSERKAIIASSLSNFELDNIGLLQVFALRHNLSGRTFIKNIFSIKPATILKWEDNHIVLSKYFIWHFSTDRNNFNKKETIEELYYGIKNAVNIRISNKERLLLWLSGGMDSRCLICSIQEKNKENVNVETYGEKESSEIKIAKDVCDTLGYNWEHRSVDLSFSQVTKIGSWRSEFAIPSFLHPFMSYHKGMKSKSDYLISGLPGIDVLNGGFITLGKIYTSLFKNFELKLFKNYSMGLSELQKIFNKKFLAQNYDLVFESFEESLSQINVGNKLDQWDIFNITERQVNFSNYSDLVENDLFETLHPFCDTDLLNVFLKIPLQNRMLQQLTKDMVFQYFPEVRDIEYDGRGLLTNNNTAITSIYKRLLDEVFPPKNKGISWDRKNSIRMDHIVIRNDIKKILTHNPELEDILNLDFINNVISNPTTLGNHFSSFGILLSFLYSYTYFLSEDSIAIPEDVIQFYK